MPLLPSTSPPFAALKAATSLRDYITVALTMIAFVEHTNIILEDHPT